MLSFFRKHQKYFFFFVTIVIVTTFVFFGSYQAFSNRYTPDDSVLYKTFDGTKVRRSHYEALCRFIGEEPVGASRRLVPESALTDGLLSVDFLERGWGLLLFKKFEKECSEDLHQKASREKLYTPYCHPATKNISALRAWELFASDIPRLIKEIQSHENPSDAQAFQNRIDLFLAERRFPPSLLSYILRSQEKELFGNALDPRLYRDDIGIFGYKNAEEWFGRNFIEKVTQCILNGVSLAKAKGYKVTDQEAMADLLEHCHQVASFYNQGEDANAIPAQQIYNRALMSTHLDERGLLNLWSDILLFKKMVKDVSFSALMDVETLRSFFAEAHETATLKIFKLPEALRFKNVEELKRFEKYISLACGTSSSLEEVPLTLASTAEIAKRAPELVGKRYVLDVVSVNKKSLYSKVTLNETWDWQVEEQNWKKMQSRFPELASKNGEDRNSRLQILDDLEKKSRARIDEFACQAIVDAHPDWMKEALESGPVEKKSFLLRLSQKEVPIKGLQDLETFKRHLETSDEFTLTSSDQQTLYKIHVKERGSELQVLTFEEALKEGLLNSEGIDCSTLLQKLFAQAKKEKIIDPSASLEDVKDKIAILRCSSLLKKVDVMHPLFPLSTKEEVITRAKPTLVSVAEAIVLAPGDVSSFKYSEQEGPFAFQLVDKKVETSVPMDKVLEIQDLLSQSATEQLFTELLCKMEASVIELTKKGGEDVG